MLFPPELYDPLFGLYVLVRVGLVVPLDDLGVVVPPLVGVTVVPLSLTIVVLVGVLVVVVLTPLVLLVVVTEPLLPSLPRPALLRTPFVVTGLIVLLEIFPPPRTAPSLPVERSLSVLDMLLVVVILLPPGPVLTCLPPPRTASEPLRPLSVTNVPALGVAAA